jgi:hypothetical protein
MRCFKVIPQHLLAGIEKYIRILNRDVWLLAKALLPGPSEDCNQKFAKLRLSFV